MEFESVERRLMIQREERELAAMGNREIPNGYKIIYPFVSQKEEDYIETAFVDEWDSLLYDIESAQTIAEEEALINQEPCTFTKEKLYFPNV